MGRLRIAGAIALGVCGCGRLLVFDDDAEAPARTADDGGAGAADGVASPPPADGAIGDGSGDRQAPAPRARSVFISSAITPGDMTFGTMSSDGILSAHARCRAEAGDARLPGAADMIAWLSVDGSGPLQQLQAGGGPWRQPGVDGIVWNDREELRAGKAPGVPIDRTAHGVPIAGAIWTGTRPNGSAIDGSTCNGWKSPNGDGVFGSIGDTSSNWTNAGTASCGVFLHLLCIEP